MFEEPVVFVDIETNGLSHSRGRIIEVAAIRVEGHEVVSRFSTILDPQTEIPAFITRLTGISSKDTSGAPTFDDIAAELLAVLDGAIFIAHNVRFDYSFVKQEFKRVGIKYSPKMLCTVKLSQALYPHYRHHKLANIIERCGLLVANRHRAYDDANALLQFMQHSIASFPAEILLAAIKPQLRRPALPKKLSPALVDSLPDEPGVYIFQDEGGAPLYIGKSTNIKKRVLSHFSRDHEAATEFKISQSVAHIEVLTTAGELEALLLESKLIKQQQPLYNRQLRRTRKMTLARQYLDEQGYIRVSIEDIERLDPEKTQDILAVYPTKSRAKQYLNQAVKDHLLCPKLLGFEKGTGGCFLYQLKKCTGACSGQEPPASYNTRLLGYFDRKRIENWPFKSPVLIEEKDPPAATPAKAIVVDQWCVIADISQDEHCETLINLYDRVFDHDTYKILSNFLKNKIHALKIKPLSQAQLSTILSQG